MKEVIIHLYLSFMPSASYDNYSDNDNKNDDEDDDDGDDDDDDDDPDDDDDNDEDDNNRNKYILSDFRLRQVSLKTWNLPLDINSTLSY